MKGYDVLKGALDGDIEYKTIIRTIHLYENGYDYDYYIYEKDRMFHRCNSEGKLGAKYQDRFLNYEVLEKDFEFYKVLEKKKEIPEKLDYVHPDISCSYNESELLLRIEANKDKINEIIECLEYLKSKGE